MKLPRSRWIWLGSILLLAVIAWLIFGFAPRIAPTVSVQTTHSTSPLADDGLPDYLAALDEIAGRGATPENNAVAATVRIVGPKDAFFPRSDSDQILKRLGIAPLPEKGDYFVTNAEAHQNDNDAIIEFDKELKQVAARPWTSDEFPEVAGWLELNAPFFDQFGSITACTHFYVPQPAKNDIDKTLIERAVILRRPNDYIRGYAALAMSDLEDGKTQQAIDRAMQIHELARLQSLGLNSVDRVNAIFIERLALQLDEAIAGHPSLSVEQAITFVSRLDQLPALDSTKSLDIYERFSALDLVVSMYRNPSLLTEQQGFLDQFKNQKPPQRASSRPNFDWDVMLTTINEEFDVLVPLAKAGDQEGIAAYRESLDQCFEETGGVPEGFWANIKLWNKSSRRSISKAMAMQVIAFSVPVFSNVDFEISRIHARRQLIRLAASLEAYRKDNGQFPTKLEAVAGKYLPKIPANPDSTVGFVYQSDGASFTLSTVNSDELDAMELPQEQKDKYVIRFPWRLPPADEDVK